MRRMFSVGVFVGIALLLAAWLAVESRAQAPEKSSIAGVWVRNEALSDPPPARGETGDGQRGDGRGRRGGGYGPGGGGGGGRGGFGGGGFGRSGGRAGNPEDLERVRLALRDIMDPPSRLTVTQTDSMIALTASDGRTTRLSPDGSKIRDENTKLERKTRWEAGRLISEISGAAGGKITQTFSIDPEKRQLRIVVEAE